MLYMCVLSLVLVIVVGRSSIGFETV